MNPAAANKFVIQDAQYAEPYHHFVSFSEDDPRSYQALNWGLKYYGYVSLVLDAAADVSFSRAAEVGCGDGKVLMELARRFPDRTFDGFDLSEQAIAFARAFSFGNERLNFFCRDFNEASATYELILCVETLEHVPDAELPAFLQAMHAKLVPGGTLIVSVPTINRPLQKKHYRHYDLQLLEQQVSALFSVESHVFAHDLRAPGARLIAALLSNRLFLLRVRSLRRVLFRAYGRSYRKAGPRSGAHLVATLRAR